MSQADALIRGPPRVRARWQREERAEVDHGTAKQCYHCQGLGHVQADCPTLRLSGAATSGRCYSCGQPGHLAVCRIFRLGIPPTVLTSHSAHVQPQARVLAAVLPLPVAATAVVVASVVDTQADRDQQRATNVADRTTSRETVKPKPSSATPAASSVTFPANVRLRTADL